jgi:hypothetical protein
MNLFKYLRVNPSTLPGGGIRIIGDVASGKTTYLAALANCYMTKDYAQGRVLSVDAFGEGADVLKDHGENRLRQGMPIPRSDRNEISTFHIKLKPSYCLDPLPAILKKQIVLKVAVTSNIGETFELLYRQENIEAIIRDCASVSGLMLIVDGLSKDDERYAKVFNTLWKGLSNSKKRSKAVSSRIAVVFTKSEQDNVSIYQDNPMEFCRLKFPKTLIELNNWQKTWRCPMKFFLCSSFGFLGNTGEPNCILAGRVFTISRFNAWKPVGLLAPIYWLHTGKDDRNLR